LAYRSIRIGQQTGILRMLVSRYPYLIVYRVTEDAVIAQRDAARKPSGAPPRGRRRRPD
jgi:hypothetical protein